MIFVAEYEKLHPLSRIDFGNNQSLQYAIEVLDINLLKFKRGSPLTNNNFQQRLQFSFSFSPALLCFHRLLFTFLFVRVNRYHLISFPAYLQPHYDNYIYYSTFVLFREMIMLAWNFPILISMYPIMVTMWLQHLNLCALQGWTQFLMTFPQRRQFQNSFRTSPHTFQVWNGIIQ